ESGNDDKDPDHFNWERFDFTSDPYQVWNAKQAKNRGVNMFMASVWSPPWWMKDTSRETNGGSLLPEIYEEFAEWLAAYIIGYKENHDIEIGWLSIQNEPDYVASWETCFYTPEQLREVVKVVGAKFKSLNLSTRIVVPETADLSDAPKYIDAIMSDPEAAKYVDVLACHLYDVSYFTPDAGIPGLKTISEYASKYNKPFWQTEYSYLRPERAGTFEEAIMAARHIHNTLTFGNASAYFVWSLFWVEGSPTLVSISRNGSSYRVNPVFYAVKQYSKFIVPESRRIRASSSNPQILVSSYIHEESGKVTVVVINVGNKPVSLKLYLKNTPFKESLQEYRTSRNESCVFMGEAGLSGNCLETIIPPESITTFVG
ncbi:MAG: glycoside hydrolase, partial [Thermoproteota archaeon]